MIQSRITIGATCALALACGARADLTIDVGRLCNVHPAPNHQYVGDWAHHISSVLVDGYSVIDIDVAGIMSEGGESYLNAITIRDFGNNSYSALSPGADIDYVGFVNLDPAIEVLAEYAGPTGEHMVEDSDQLMNRLHTLDAFTGANQADDDVYVSLGRLGELQMRFTGNGGGDGSGGGGEGGDGDDDGTGIDPFGSDGLASGLVLRIGESGSMERFTVHLETSEVPAPGALSLLCGFLMKNRRRRA